MKWLTKISAILLFAVLLTKPMELIAQPYDCINDDVCQGLCNEDGLTCWNIDDPVPLDNGLLILCGLALTFGLYKLNRRRQLLA